MRIAHLTSVHTRDDVRIFHKQCRSLARHGHEVFLVVADGAGNEFREGVQVLDVGASTSRLRRMFTSVGSVMRMARDLRADIYHLHDPELIPGGLRLKRGGGAVIFDAHEDLPRQILYKPYVPRPTRWALSIAAERFQRWSCARLDGIVAATPHIRDCFLPINSNTENINNYPEIDELYVPERQGNSEERSVIYAGSISAVRGALEMVDAIATSETQPRLLLAGHFNEAGLESELARKPGWERVQMLGHLARPQLAERMAGAVAGLVVLHPVPAHLDALPNKLFEYMSAGIPVIASNFPEWRNIVETYQCGVCVDPLRPGEIAAAIDLLTGDAELAARMGQNGRTAVIAERNWSLEEAKLTSFYDPLISRRGKAE